MHTNEYEMFLGHVYRLTERRQTVTTTYLSVNTALAGAIAFLFKDGQLPSLPSQVSALVFLISGIVVCSLWRRLLTHYSALLGWWYNQLRVLETMLPDSGKLITKEYQELFVHKSGKGPIGITRYETSLTWLFTIIYLVFGATLLIALVISRIA